MGMGMSIHTVAIKYQVEKKFVVLYIKNVYNCKKY